MRFLFGHPFSKALGFGLLAITGNVLAGAYVFEITKVGPNGQFLDWAASIQSWSFRGLTLVLLVTGAFGWATARYEARARKALTEAEFLGIALGELLDPMIEAVKTDIKDGKRLSLDDIKKMFGTDQRGPT